MYMALGVMKSFLCFICKTTVLWINICSFSTIFIYKLALVGPDITRRPKSKSARFRIDRPISGWDTTTSGIWKRSGSHNWKVGHVTPPLTHLTYFLLGPLARNIPTKWRHDQAQCDWNIEILQYRQCALKLHIHALFDGEGVRRHPQKAPRCAETRRLSHQASAPEPRFDLAEEREKIRKRVFW